MKFKSTLLLYVFALGVSSCVFSRDIYVTKSGSDSNAGTISAPYLTISKAASVAVAGDIVYIGEGTYEETLNPANSGTAGNPIVFQSIPGEKVIITAMEALSGWTQESGAIYKTSIPFASLADKNFVMNEATALNLARWPNKTISDPFAVEVKLNTSGSGPDVINGAFIAESSIPNIDWSGGAVWFYGGGGWLAWKREITSSTGGRVNFTLNTQNGGVWVRTAHAPSSLGEFYLEGVKDALDYENEWYFNESTNELFVQLPGGAAPVDGKVQMRRRIETINLKDKKFIEIRNLAVFGGAINMEDSSTWQTNGNNRTTNNVLYGVSSFYGNNSQGMVIGARTNSASISLQGSNNRIERCEIAFNAGAGLKARGKNLEIIDNYIHDCNFLGYYDAPLEVRGIQNSLVKNNTIFNGGRDCIQYNGSDNEFSFNDVSQSNKVAQDCALFYTVGQQYTTEIHHNWFHDTQARGSRYKAAGIYLDNDGSGFSVHHNVVWNTEWSSVQMNWNAEDNDIFNNTLWDGSKVMDAWHKEGTAFARVRVWNNLGSNGDWEPQSDRQNNLVVDASVFEDASSGNFNLNNGSTPIDQGKLIPGITDGFLGANPDVGAYEHGGERWVAGISWNPENGPTGNGCYDLPGENCGPCTPVGWYLDEDGDGLGDPATEVLACTRPFGYIADNNDACPTDILNTCTIVHTTETLIQAEEYTNQSGVVRENTSDTGGGQNLGFIENNDFVEYNTNIPTAGIYEFNFRVASASQGGTITVTTNAGVETASRVIPNTSGWQNWQEFSVPMNLQAGTQLIRLTFNGTAAYLMNLNWLEIKSNVLSNDNFEILGFKVYPNPAKNTLKVDGLREAHVFSIFDVTGRAVMSNLELNENTNDINVSKFPKGVYFLVERNSGSTYKFAKH